MANTYTNILFHIVFSTKNREPLIHNALKPELHKYLGGLVRDIKGILLEVGGMADHVAPLRQAAARHIRFRCGQVNQSQLIRLGE